MKLKKLLLHKQNKKSVEGNFQGAQPPESTSLQVAGMKVPAAGTEPGESDAVDGTERYAGENSFLGYDAETEELPVIPLEPLVRVKPSLSGGLTEEQVQSRIAHGAINTPVDFREF